MSRNHFIVFPPYPLRDYVASISSEPLLMCYEKDILIESLWNGDHIATAPLLPLLRVVPLPTR